MAKPIIEFNNVFKEYRLYKKGRQLFENQLLGLDRGIPEPALDDISFTVEKGEKLALIGNTGIERDVVMEMISGITSPDSGRVRVRGSVALAIGFGSGFDNNLSVTDNIMVKGYMLGWSRQQIAERTDRILEFAELTDKRSYRLKNLAPGDAGRIGLAMFCEEDADIYVLNSVLNVGDHIHRAKCIERLKEVTGREDKTLILADRNVAVGNNLCTRGIVFDGCKIAFDGTVKEGVKYFRDNIRRTEDDTKQGKPVEGVKEIKESDFEEF